MADPKNENYIYSSIYFMNIFRFPSATPGKKGFDDVSPKDASAAERKSVWMSSKRSSSSRRRRWPSSR
ncbi:MAG TPA: hypothetical protein VGT40_11520 [Methylomirabilota bacterium]|nr:hypothetical protein [Methylomirabilota bacterium]